MKNGFTFLELILGLFLFAMLMAMVFPVLSSSSQTSMNAHYEFVAMQIAKEPLEVFRAMGYRWIQACADSPQNNPLGDYPLNSWHSIRNPLFGNPQNPIHPAETEMFDRMITLDRLQKNGINGFFMTVLVKPKNQTKVMAWFRREMITLSTIIFEQPL